jgi:hypothetical protein
MNLKLYTYVDFLFIGHVEQSALRYVTNTFQHLCSGIVALVVDKARQPRSNTIVFTTIEVFELAESLQEKRH